jgi:hypothetical protein
LKEILKKKVSLGLMENLDFQDSKEFLGNLEKMVMTAMMVMMVMKGRMDMMENLVGLVIEGNLDFEDCLDC